MRYSVYVFLDHLNRPYYVGMTSNFSKRKKEHLFEIKTGNVLPKYRWARMLYVSKKHPFKMRIIKTVYNQKEAFRLEHHYIRKFRKEGYRLMNCTKGGPDEKPIKLNKPLKENKKGLKFK